ncbi:MAG: hypothetical protein Q9170_006113 [Blastenia crenularia]
MEDKQYTTDLAKDEFLANLGYDFNIAHNSQLIRIQRLGQYHLIVYGRLNILLKARLLHFIPNRTNSALDPHVRRFSDELESLIWKSEEQLSKLRDMIERVLRQHRLLIENLRNQYAPLPRPRPALPVKVESLFRPGPPITIVWEDEKSTGESDELSTLTDAGDEEWFV